MYCTIADIKEGLPENEVEELTDDRDSSLSSDEIVNGYITSAAAVINSFISKQYDPIPITPTPDLLNKFSVDITIFNLRSRKQGKIEEGIKSRFEAAMKHLKLIAEGKASLGTGDSDIEADADEQVLHSHEESDRVLTVNKPSESFAGSLNGF